MLDFVLSPVLDPGWVRQAVPSLRHFDPVVAELVLEQDVARPLVEVEPMRHRRVAVTGMDGLVPRLVREVAPGGAAFSRLVVDIGVEHVLRVAAVADALAPTAHLWPAKVAQLAFTGVDGEVAVHARAPVHRPFGQRLYALARPSASPSGGAWPLARASSK